MNTTHFVRRHYNVSGVRNTVILLWNLRNTRRNANKYTIVMYVGKNLMMLLNVLKIQLCVGKLKCTNCDKTFAHWKLLLQHNEDLHENKS